MKKILIISPDSRHFVREHIENVLIGHNYSVTYFTISRNTEDISFFNENRVKYIGIKKDNDASKLANIGGYVNSFLWLLRVRNQYDVIHIHFMEARFLLFCKSLLKSRARLVITFWGSDLLRDGVSSSKISKSFRPWIEKAAAINLMEDNSKRVFDELYGDVDINKAKVLDFGDSLLDVIDREVDSLGREKAKEKYGFPKDKIIIHIGYNGSAAHQHIKLLAALIELPQEYKNRLFIVMHFGYGIGGCGYSGEEYLAAVYKVANTTGIDYKIITDYLIGTDLADFRLTADVMLYGQITDAISASVVETIYAGGLFINPKWLDYSQLKEEGIQFIEYNKFEEIQKIIEEIIDGYCLSDEQLQSNKRAIRKLKGWDILAPKWRELYED